MARRSLFAVATFAFGILGANAGPCRPSTTVTTVAETSSTAVAETSPTTLVEASSSTVVESSSTTVAESSSTTAAETSSTTVVESSSTTLVETSSTIPAETSTTSEPPNCVATQAVGNPSFEDTSGAPWSGVADLLSDEDAHTGSLSAGLRFWNGGGSTINFSQDLTNLQASNYRLSYWWRVTGWSPWQPGSGFGCSVDLRLGGRQLQSLYISESAPPRWVEETQIWSRSIDDETAELSFSVQCTGEFDNIDIAIDDVTLTEIKCEPLQT